MESTLAKLKVTSWNTNCITNKKRINHIFARNAVKHCAFNPITNIT